MFGFCFIRLEEWVMMVILVMGCLTESRGPMFLSHWCQVVSLSKTHQLPRVASSRLDLKIVDGMLKYKSRQTKF